VWLLAELTAVVSLAGGAALARGAAVTVALAEGAAVTVAVAKEAWVVARKEAWVAARTVAESSAVEGGASGDPRECAEVEWAAVG